MNNIQHKIKNILHRYAKWNLELVAGDITPNKHEAARIEGQFVKEIMELIDGG